MNLANGLTLFRIILVPVFVAFLLTDGLPRHYLYALLVFAAASVTDFLDGYVARKYDMITPLGKFLDPIADKILTASALICFVPFGWVEAWVVAVIISREFIVSGIRLAAVESEEKIVIQASFSGKLKTAFTMLAICFFLTCSAVTGGEFPPFAKTTGAVLMYICAALTVISGIRYAWDYRHIFKPKSQNNGGYHGK
ncbi:MAG: CDP-diacylglycerol--glycerol-3-phosphate 3-phosphatidyltransferase [Oscillospiraceae bacterium]|jgi:CDP-diacylglycerol--glycerol-3-phosphate 3-phosphatidyltransferase|nr:CDP-diacylglycerol--glycerol-3-phosphate 3-phosphatidyltransferase [Oscillospiraceae bacterium]